MAGFFGVHIGNSSACLAICKDEGRVDIVANDAGDRITPTVLQWTPNGCTIGRTAIIELFRNTSNTIIRNKQLVNFNIEENELNNLRNTVSYKIHQTDGNIKYELLYEGKQYHVSPNEIAGWIFKKLFSIAQSAAGGSKELNIVVSVPLFYPQKSILLIKEVAKKAGFHVLQVVDEPSVAALGCGLGLDLNESPYYCLVYRVGGYSIDATILLVQNGMFTVVDSVHKYHLGGVLFTEKLSEFLANEFKRQFRTAEISERGKYKLLVAAETVKLILSVQNVAQCSCESIGSGYDFNCSVSRARFENIIASLLPDIIAPILEVLSKSNMSAERINKVVTCGGSLKIPKLQEMVQKIFPSSEFIMNTSPDELIAVGAAKQAGYVDGYGHYPDSLSVDSLSLPASLILVIKQEEGKEETHLIPENTLVPFRKRFNVLCTWKNLTAYILYNNNVSLGSTSLNNLEPPFKMTLILDIYKDGKILLTFINEVNKEKTYLKCDLHQVSKI